MQPTSTPQLSLFSDASALALDRGADEPFEDFIQSIFPRGVELIPQLNEVYELQLAFGEATTLDQSALAERGAYFMRVGDRITHHFLLCSGAPLSVSSRSSLRLRSFFKTNQFKTGYATHGLFPYRGKFHPQMIKALINVIGLKPGMTVLDPMGGSGTTVVEAATMGINAISYDLSPFCTLMTRAKLDGLSLQGRELQDILAEWLALQRALDNGKAPSLPHGLRRLVTLAYLDSRGYAARTNNRSNRNLFQEILARYAAAIAKFAKARDKLGLELGDALAETADARELPLPSESIDGIVFSPPYSFAVDYIENDLLHLDFLGEDVGELRSQMVGLRGEKRRQRVDLYFDDMRAVIGECHRVLRPGRLCVIVVGSNTSQLKSILRTSDAEQVSIEHRLVNLGSAVGLQLAKRMVRQITGLANVMRDEHILFLRKT